MSFRLNSLKGVIWGIIYGTTTGVIKGDTRSLDSSSYIHNIYLWKECEGFNVSEGLE